MDRAAPLSSTTPARRRSGRVPESSCALAGDGRSPAAISRIRLLGGLDQRLHRSDRLVEHRLLLGVQLDLDDALDAAGADHHRHADIEALDAVFAVQQAAQGSTRFLSLQIGLRPSRSPTRPARRRPSRSSAARRSRRRRRGCAGRSASSFSCVVQPILTRSGSGMPATVE